MTQSYWIKPDGDILEAPEGHVAFIKEHWQEHDLPEDIDLSDLIIQGWIRVSKDNVIIRNVESPDVLEKLGLLLIELGYNPYTFWVDGRPYYIPLEDIKSRPIIDIYKDIVAGKLEKAADAYDQGMFEYQPSWNEMDGDGSTAVKERGVEFMPQDYTKEVWWNRELLDYLRKNFPGKKDVIPPEPDIGYPSQASNVVIRLIKKANKLEKIRKLCPGCAKCCMSSELGIEWVDIKEEDIKKWKQKDIYKDIKPFISPSSIGYQIDFDIHGGQCPFLDEYGLCSIYENRPLECHEFTCFGKAERIPKIAISDQEIVCRHNRSNNRVPENLINSIAVMIAEKMNVSMGFAMSLINSYNQHTITNAEFVNMVNRFLQIDDTGQSNTEKWEERWHKRSSLHKKAVWSVWDNQNGSWMESGKNSESLEDAVDEMIGYLSVDMSDEDAEFLESASLEDRKRYVEDYEFEFKEEFVEGDLTPEQEAEAMQNAVESIAKDREEKEKEQGEKREKVRKWEERWHKRSSLVKQSKWIVDDIWHHYESENLIDCINFAFKHFIEDLREDKKSELDETDVSDLTKTWETLLPKDKKDYLERQGFEFKQDESDKTHKWEERWHKRSSLLKSAEDPRGKIEKLQAWTDADKPVPKFFSGANASYDLDSNYILHIQYYSTEIVTVDMKNKKLLKSTKGRYDTISTKKRISDILHSLNSMGYPVPWDDIFRYEYDANQTPEEREQEKQEYEEKEKEYRRLRGKERYQEKVKDKKEQEMLQQQYPKEYKALQNKGKTRITLRDIEEYKAEEEKKEKTRLWEERWHKRSSLRKRAVVTEEDVKESLKKHFAPKAVREFTGQSRYGDYGMAGTFMVGRNLYNWIFNEEEAEKIALRYVKNDLEESPEVFNQDWLIGQIDSDKAEYFFTQMYDEFNESYVGDIENEKASSDEYDNRLEEEMADAGVSTKEEYVSYMTRQQIADGESGASHYRDNFGQEELNKLILDNNLIDIDSAAESAIDADGWAHFLSQYDESYDTTEDGIVYFLEDKNYKSEEDKSSEKTRMWEERWHKRSMAKESMEKVLI